MPEKPYGDGPDPDTLLWTVMCRGPLGLQPYAPAYTAIPHDEAQRALFYLRGRFPFQKFVLSEAKTEQISRDQGRKAIRKILRDAERHDLLPAVAKVRRADLPLLAPLAFDAQRKADRKLEWQRINEARKQQGLAPLPLEPDPTPEPEVITRRKQIVIRLGGAR